MSDTQIPAASLLPHLREQVADLSMRLAAAMALGDHYKAQCGELQNRVTELEKVAEEDDPARD